MENTNQPVITEEDADSIEEMNQREMESENTAHRKRKMKNKNSKKES